MSELENKKMEFNSQICTTNEQSERLLILGLKKETADMSMYYKTHDLSGGKIEPDPEFLGYLTHPMPCEERQTVLFSRQKFIPAWSLHRLIEMIQEVCPQVVIIFHRVDIRSNVKRIAYSFDVCDNLYDNIVDCIEWLIKEGYFNKDYLRNV